jgi:release factor glutamine methyltransferase
MCSSEYGIIKNTTVRQLLIAAATTLRTVSSTPRLDAELLLAHVLGWSRAHLLAEQAYIPTADYVVAFQQLTQRRAQGEPVAYLVGYRSFYGLDLLVDQRVLVPRPETELLVELALGLVREQAIWSVTAHAVPAYFIADVGTGSGAIAVALAVHLADVHMYATDISEAALEVAHANVERHGVGETVTLLHGDLLTPLPRKVDLIVSNPPYTILAEIDADVREHEPHLALDGGSDGLAVYRRLFAEAPAWLVPGGSILMEIGATQATAVSALAHTMFPLSQVTVHRDLAGHNRILAVRTVNHM